MANWSWLQDLKNPMQFLFSQLLSIIFDVHIFIVIIVIRYGMDRETFQRFEKKSGSGVMLLAGKCNR